MVEIFVNNTRLDLIDNVSIPITYSISDIKNPQSREGTYSKTITLPGTKTNNKLFTHIFKVNKLSYRDWETDRKSTRLNSSH